MLEAAGGEASAAENAASAPDIREDPDERTPKPERWTDE
jgi:hypothetical protein